MSAQNDQKYPGYPQWFEYVVPHPEDSKWGLLVTAAGTTNVPPGGEYPARNHPDTHYFRWEEGRKFVEEYGLILVTEGSGSLETSNCGLQRIEAGNLFMLFPGIWHRYRPDPEVGWDEYWFNLQGPLARQILSPPFFDPCIPVLQTGVHTELLSGFLKIAELVRDLTPGLRPTLAATAMSVLANLFELRTKNSGVQSDAEKTTASAKAFMLLNYSDEIDFPKLAATLGVSYSTFRRVFKRQAGISPNQYLIQIRLEHARDQLLHSGKSIYQIALDNGFTTPEYFARLFRRKFGQTPSHLRNP